MLANEEQAKFIRASCYSVILTLIEQILLTLNYPVGSVITKVGSDKQ